MKILLCESNPMCYGSSTVLLSIINNLQMETVCLASGVAKEVLVNGKSNIVDVNNKSSKEVETAIKNLDFDSVLVVSNTSNLALYKSLKKRIYFVHIHFFYPNAQTDILQLANLLFVQNFWNLQQLNSAIKVGPLIKAPNKKIQKKNKILVNLGGGESIFIQPGINSDYGIQMLNLIIQLKPYFLNSEIIICGGNKIIETIRAGAIENHIEAITLSNERYLELLDEAEILVSSPGLNAIFEAIYRDIPVMFLPPQNVSQVYQLKGYENAGLSVKGLNLTLPDYSLTEEEQTKSFLKEMTTKYIENSVVSEHLSYLSAQMKYIQTKEYKDKVASAMEFLGKIGSSQISKTINNDYRN